MRRMIPLWSIGLALACRSPADRAGAEAVRRYNDVVVAAYRANDQTHLRDVATVKEARRIFVLIDFKKASEVVLESTLASLAVTGVERISDERMTVRTEERWRYHDRPIAPGAPAGPEYLADMHAEYDLVEESGVWKVSGVRIPWNQYYDPRTEQPIPRPDFAPVRGKGLVHTAPGEQREQPAPR